MNSDTNGSVAHRPERPATEGEFSALLYIKNAVRKHINRFDVFVLTSSFFLTFLVHLYMFTHKFINHDDVGGLYSDCAFGLSSGRWLLHFVTGWNGNFSSSWLNGLAGAFYLAIAVWLVVRLFRVKHRLPALLIALTMISFPTVASTYSYMFCSAQYLFSLAFSVIGACCIYKGSVTPALLQLHCPWVAIRLIFAWLSCSWWSRSVLISAKTVLRETGRNSS